MRLKEHKLTEFQKQVFSAVLEIPFGQTRSYQWVADKIRRPKAVRAVGQALKFNPYPLIIPCHRVINSDGSLGGYCGSKNTARKERILKIEKIISLFNHQKA